MRKLKFASYLCAMSDGPVNPEVARARVGRLMEAVQIECQRKMLFRTWVGRRCAKGHVAIRKTSPFVGCHSSLVSSGITHGVPVYIDRLSFRKHA